MIDAGGVDADQLHLLFDQPSGRGLAQTRRMAKIFLAVGISAMPAGIDQYDIAGKHGRCRRFQIFRFDQLPLPLRDRQHDAGAKETVERQVADGGGLWDQMDRRVHVCRGVEDGGDLVRHHALLGVVRDALELDLLIAGEDRSIHAPGMAELDKSEPALRIDHLRHCILPASSWRAQTDRCARPLWLRLCVVLSRSSNSLSNRRYEFW